MAEVSGGFVEIAGLVMILGALLIYGRGLLKAQVNHNWAAWLLILSVPAGILVVFLLVYYFPNGPMFFFCLSWIVLGYWTMNERGNASVSEALA